MDVDKFYECCKVGQISDISLSTLNETQINYGFCDACNNGHLNVIKWFISKGVNNIEGCRFACANGFIDIVKYLISVYMCDYNRSFIDACINGQLKIVVLLASTNHVDIENYNRALYFCYVWNRWEIIDFLIYNRRGLFKHTPDVCHICWFSRDAANILLERGVLVETFSCNIKCVELLQDIQTFKTNVLINLYDSLIPELSKMISDYSLN